MRRMRLDASAVGQQLAEAPTDQTGRRLVASGEVLDEQILGELRAAGVHYVGVVDPAFEDLHVASIVSPQTQRLAAAVYAEAKNRIIAQPNAPLPRPPFFRLAQAVVQDASDQPLDHSSYLTPANLAQRDEVLALNRASLAVRLATSRAMSRYDLDLAYAALTCDLGLALVPEELRFAAGPLTAEERERVEEHVRTSLRLLDAGEGWSAVTRAAVAHHHERLDGSGYPHGMQGEEIHPTAVNLMVCDVFAEMLLPHPGRSEVRPEDALAEVQGSAGGPLDYDTVVAFNRIIPPYPVGTEVELSTGERAVVLQVHQDLKSRPVVRVFLDRDGNRLQTFRELDLSDRELQTTTVMRVIA